MLRTCLDITSRNDAASHVAVCSNLSREINVDVPSKNVVLGTDAVLDAIRNSIRGSVLIQQNSARGNVITHTREREIAMCVMMVMWWLTLGAALLVLVVMVECLNIAMSCSRSLGETSCRMKLFIIGTETGLITLKEIWSCGLRFIRKGSEYPTLWNLLRRYLIYTGKTGQVTFS
jgi:hypothetical protein